jgi:hypothetical protein
MAVPKGFRNNININPSKIGPERRQEILDDIADRGTFLPRGVSEEDMDESFVEFINNDLSISVDGEKVPVLFMTLQRWSEFTKTWQHADKNRSVELPVITIVRRPDIQVGQNQAGNYNIPGMKTYTYVKIPTFDGVRSGVDLYKVPQPTSVDITYEIRLFTKKMRDLNKLNTLIHKTFNAMQAYINVKGHPMPVMLENISDESNVEDLDSRRYYVQLYEMRLMGYILDENDFEVVPTINRALAFIELDENKRFHNVIFDPYVQGNLLTYTFVFKPRSEPRFSFTAKYDLVFNQLTNIENTNRIIITINGSGVFDGTVLTTPIIINAGDEVGIRVHKTSLVTSKFQLIGNTI